MLGRECLALWKGLPSTLLCRVGASAPPSLGWRLVVALQVQEFAGKDEAS